MQSRMTRLGLVLALSAPLTLADFRYDQSSRMTGGAMMGMMQLAARFSKNAMQPMNSTIAVKGNRMVMNHGKTATIYDLDKETVTEVNFEKKEASVTTFAEMKAFMAKAVKSTQGGDTSYEIDVKETGKTEVVNGMKAREFLMTMKITMNNPQTGKPGEMRMEMSNWLGDALPGYEEVAEFHKRMAQKMDMAAMFGGSAQGGMGQGMAAAAKKMAEMKGIPVVQVMRTIPTDPEQIKQMEESQKQMAQAQAQQGQQPSVGDAAGQAAGQSAAGAVAGRLGRLGGLGSTGLGGLGGLRRKKQQQEEPPPAPAAPAAEAAPAGGATPATSTAPVKGTFSSEASLMEMTIESKNHSNSSVEASMFEVPAGFKTVKSAMQR